MYCVVQKHSLPFLQSMPMQQIVRKALQFKITELNFSGYLILPIKKCFSTFHLLMIRYLKNEMLPKMINNLLRITRPWESYITFAFRKFVLKKCIPFSTNSYIQQAGILHFSLNHSHISPPYLLSPSYKTHPLPSWIQIHAVSIVL